MARRWRAVAVLVVVARSARAARARCARGCAVKSCPFGPRHVVRTAFFFAVGLPVIHLPTFSGLRLVFMKAPCVLSDKKKCRFLVGSACRVGALFYGADAGSFGGWEVQGADLRGMQQAAIELGQAFEEFVATRAQERDTDRTLSLIVGRCFIGAAWCPPPRSVP